MSAWPDAVGAGILLAAIEAMLIVRSWVEGEVEVEDVFVSRICGNSPLIRLVGVEKSG